MEIIPERGEHPAEDVADHKGYHKQQNCCPQGERQNAPCALHHMQRHHPIRKRLSDANPNKD